MRLIYLKWQDACSNAGWFSKKETNDWIKEASEIVEQVGWLYKEDKKQIILASRLDGQKDEEQGLGGLQKIPKTWILKRIDLTRQIKKR